MLIPFGILSAAASFGPISISVAGYVAGGGNSVTSDFATVDKFAFPADTRTTLGTGLSAARRTSGGFADSGVAGYVAGGFNPSAVATVDKFAFPADTRTTLGTGLPVATSSSTSFANSAVAGYVAGGAAAGGLPEITTVTKFAFPSDTRSNVTAGLSVARYGFGGFANVEVAGYAHGGYRESIDTNVGTVDKFAFPADTRTTLGTGLSGNRRTACGFANASVAGYASGGFESTAVATVDKFAFPSDTRTTLATGLSTARQTSGGFADSGVAGYVAGGFTGAGARVATVDKFALPTDTRSTLATGLSDVRNALAAFADEGVF
jgi:hypothetical protein